MAGAGHGRRKQKRTNDEQKRVLDDAAPDHALELDADPDFHARLWKIQFIGWIAIGLLLAATVAGAFGGGPLAWETRTVLDGRVQVEWPRISRYRLPEKLSVRLAEPLEDEQIVIRFDDRFLRQVQIETVQPWPDGGTMIANGGSYAFSAPQAGDIHITMWFRPMERWSVAGSVTVNGSEPVELSTFVFP